MRILEFTQLAGNHSGVLRPGLSGEEENFVVDAYSAFGIDLLLYGHHQERARISQGALPLGVLVEVVCVE